MSEDSPPWRHVVEHLLFPEIKLRLLVPKEFGQDNRIILQLTTLEQLYKVFERC